MNGTRVKANKVNAVPVTLEQGLSWLGAGPGRSLALKDTDLRIKRASDGNVIVFAEPNFKSCYFYFSGAQFDLFEETVVPTTWSGLFGLLEAGKVLQCDLAAAEASCQVKVAADSPGFMVRWRYAGNGTNWQGWQVLTKFDLRCASVEAYCVVEPEQEKPAPELEIVDAGSGDLRRTYRSDGYMRDARVKTKSLDGFVPVTDGWKAIFNVIAELKGWGLVK